MPRGIVGSRCEANSRHTGEQCRRSAAPFSDPARCIHHGAAAPAAVARARERYEAYEAKKLAPEDTDQVRAINLEAFQRAEQRRVRRDMARKGVLGDYDDQHGDPGVGAARFNHWSEERKAAARNGEPPPPSVRAASPAVSKVEPEPEPDPGPRTRTSSPTPTNPPRRTRTPAPTPPPEANPRPGSKPPGNGPGSREVLPNGTEIQPEGYPEDLEDFQAREPERRGAYYPAGSPDWNDLIYG